MRISDPTVRLAFLPLARKELCSFLRELMNLNEVSQNDSLQHLLGVRVVAHQPAPGLRIRRPGVADHENSGAVLVVAPRTVGGVDDHANRLVRRRLPALHRLQWGRYVLPHDLRVVPPGCSEFDANFGSGAVRDLTDRRPLPVAETGLREIHDVQRRQSSSGNDMIVGQ